jgi:hypothetical protein
MALVASIWRGHAVVSPHAYLAAVSIRDVRMQGFDRDYMLAVLSLMGWERVPEYPRMGTSTEYVLRPHGSKYGAPLAKIRVFQNKSHLYLNQSAGVRPMFNGRHDEVLKYMKREDIVCLITR